MTTKSNEQGRADFEARVLREASKKKRGENRQSSAEILRRLGVFFETNNNGVHLVVRHGGRVADFWPGTGKYTIRGSGSYQRGVFNLLRELGVKCERK